MKMTVLHSCAVWFLLSADSSDAFVAPGKWIQARTTAFTPSSTNLFDIVSAYQKKKSYTASPQPPELNLEPAPDIVVIEPPLETIPEPAISIPEPILTIPDSVVTTSQPILTLPEPEVVERVVQELATQTPASSSRAPTIFEFIRNNLGAVKESAKTIQDAPDKLLAPPVSSESFDAMANAKEKFTIMKGNLFGGIHIQTPSEGITTTGSSDLNAKLNILKENAETLPKLILDDEFIRKSTDIGKAIGGVAAGAAATSSDFGNLANTLMDNIRFRELGGWYVAGFAILFAFVQRRVGFDEAREQFTARLEAADRKAAEAAQAATLAAQGAKMAVTMANRADAITSRSLLEASKTRAIQVDKEMMESALKKLSVETEALKKQLAATKVTMDTPALNKPMEQFTAEMMAEMEDPEADARILALIKQVDEENKAKKAAKVKEEADEIAAENVKAEKIAAAKAKAEKIAAAKAEADKVKAEMVAAAKAEADKVKAEMVAAVAKAEADKKAAAKAASEKVKAEKVEIDKKAASEAAAEKAAAAKVEIDKKAAASKAEAEKMAASKADAEKMAASKAIIEKSVVERAVTTVAESNKKVVAEKVPTIPISESMFFAAGETIKPLPKATKGTKKSETKPSVPKADKKVATPKAEKKVAVPKAEKPIDSSSVGINTDTNPWKSLSLSTLKRKTAKDLTAYLDERGSTGINGDGKPLSKEELVSAVQNL